MSRSCFFVVLATCALALASCRNASNAQSPRDVVARASRPGLAAFESERELERFLRDLARAERTKDARLSLAAGAKMSCKPDTCESLGADCGVHSDGCGKTIDCGPCAAGEAPAAASPEAAEADGVAESITNVQHAGVDEGGIVKRAGDHLIVLRRGRLFSVNVAGDELEPVSNIDAFGPDIDPGSTWYDELLVADRTVIVIGFSYSHGGTEIGLFDIDPVGKLSHRATYHLRSNDYYSSRNYASRLIDQRLIFYTPLDLRVEARNLYESFPAMRKWRKGAKPRHFERTVQATSVYRPIFASHTLALHTVTVCDLATRELGCDSTSVMGPAGRVFYVSPEAVYVWVTERGEGSLVYRLPLDRSRPSALRARGSPVDQFSFLESSDHHLNVLLRAEASGDGMWSSELSAGDVALLRVELDRFTAVVERAPHSSYRTLPKPTGSTLQNRFVGDHVLYGTGDGWGTPRARRQGTLFVHRYAADEPTARLALGHGVDRIEALGDDAIVIGAGGRDLHFTPIALGARPWAAGRFTHHEATQGELRSHGFFHRADGARSGLLGLPVRQAGRPGFEHLFRDSAAVLFVKNRGLALSALGTLAADPESAEDDGCLASCVDWYGNARPLFLGDRIFALLGYEIVEGEVRRGRLREKRRVSFAPK